MGNTHSYHQLKTPKKQHRISRSLFNNPENKISSIGSNNNNNNILNNKNINDYYYNSCNSISTTNFLDLNLKIINGRTFLFSDDYFFPVDYEEADRLQLQHYMYIQIWESYFSSPIKTLLNLGGMNVLDVGCGPALWLMEMATFFPLSNFTGVDIVQLYPSDCMPSNLDFIQANILDGLPFENESFDFIHIKDCLPYFPGKVSKEQLFSELVRLLKPGGWLEIIEFEGKMYDAGPNSDFLYDKLITVYRNRGINFVLESVPRLFEDNNLVEFRREDKIIKYCEFDFALQVFLDTFKTMKKTILEFTSLEPEKYEEMLSNSCRELLDYQTSFRNTRFYGQKPLKFETI